METNSNQVNCQNCETPYKEGYEFCPHCGQKTNDELTIGVLFYNTISNYFSFDARFLKSFFPLMFRPGYLAKKFLEGKRLLFLHPAQMYLFVSVIFFFIISFSVRKTARDVDTAMQKTKTTATVNDSTSNDNKPFIEVRPLDSAGIEKVMAPLKQNQKMLGLNEEDLKAADSILKQSQNQNNNLKTSFGFNEEKIDSLIAAGESDDVIYKEMGMREDAGFFTRKFYTQMLKFYKDRGLGAIIQTFFDTIPISMFFLLPLFAFILKIFYFKRGRYSHHLVFSFYYFSFLFTVFSIIFGVNMIWDIPDWIDWLVALSTFFYLLVAITRFYRQHWLLSFIKTSMISFVFLLMVLPFAFGVLVFFAFLFY